MLLQIQRGAFSNHILQIIFEIAADLYDYII
jgi:hypothetical protein